MLARHSLSMHFSLCLCLNASMHTSFEASVEHAIQDAKAGTFCRNLRVSTTYRQSTCVNPERKTRLDAILFAFERVSKSAGKAAEEHDMREVCYIPRGVRWHLVFGYRPSFSCTSWCSLTEQRSCITALLKQPHLMDPQKLHVCQTVDISEV